MREYKQEIIFRQVSRGGLSEEETLRLRKVLTVYRMREGAQKEGRQGLASSLWRVKPSEVCG